MSRTIRYRFVIGSPDDRFRPDGIDCAHYEAWLESQPVARCRGNTLTEAVGHLVIREANQIGIKVIEAIDGKSE